MFHINDEAYEYFTYGHARHFSPGSIGEAAGHTISLFSLSKAFGMASWRVGFMVIPDALWDAVNKIQDTLLICPPAVSQHAALAALRVGRSYPRGYLDRLDAMRHAIFEALNDSAVPCDVAPVEGAFYYLVRVHSTVDSMTLVERLIREHRVATIPGSAFADTAPCSLRISYGALAPTWSNKGWNGSLEGSARSRSTAVPTRSRPSWTSPVRHDSVQTACPSPSAARLGPDRVALPPGRLDSVQTELHFPQDGSTRSRPRALPRAARLGPDRVARPPGRLDSVQTEVHVPQGGFDSVQTEVHVPQGGFDSVQTACTSPRAASTRSRPRCTSPRAASTRPDRVARPPGAATRTYRGRRPTTAASR